MRSVELALMVVFQVALLGLAFFFLPSLLAQPNLELPGQELQGDTLLVDHEGESYSVEVLTDSEGQLRPAETEADVEDLVLRSIPGEQGSLSGWLQELYTIPELP